MRKPLILNANFGDTKLPKHHITRLDLYMLALFAYWFAPIAYAMGLWYELEMGEFAVVSDSISIPLFAFLVLWLIGFPVFLLATITFEILMRKLDVLVGGSS